MRAVLIAVVGCACVFAQSVLPPPSTGAGGVPSGPAGGVLGGAYPNPTLGGAFSNNDCLKAAVSGGVTTVVTAGAPCSAGGGVTSVSGTSNQVTVTPTTGAAVVSLPTSMNLPGTTLALGSLAVGGSAPASEKLWVHISTNKDISFVTGTVAIEQFTNDADADYIPGQINSSLLELNGGVATGNVLVGGSTDGNYRLDVQKSGSSGTFRCKDQTATTGHTYCLDDLGVADTTSTVIHESKATLKSVFLQTSILTVATLPTCNGGSEGFLSAVSDATAPAFLVTVVGGGTVHAAVYCNGTNWVAN